MSDFPPLGDLTICFAHPAYRLIEAYGEASPGFQVRSKAELAERAPEADVIVVSGLWDNAILERSPRLRFVQSVSAGVNQFDADAFRRRGIRLASAQGANERAVSQHGMALILASARRLPEARDNQAKRYWRPMQADHSLREDELGGKTVLIVGLGRIGGRLARLAKAFDMTVLGVRRTPTGDLNGADAVFPMSELPSLLGRADFVVLTCPLTDETHGLMDAGMLALMKPDGHLVNLARGACVVEDALAAALTENRIGDASLDVTELEPLPESSPLWTLPNVFITPHTAGETRRYEASVIEMLHDNLGRLARGEHQLRNQIV